MDRVARRGASAAPPPVAKSSLPPGWDPPAHQLWLAGRQLDAIQAALGRINAAGQPSVPLALQAAYYLAMHGDYGAAAQLLAHAHRLHPGDKQVLMNLSVCLSRSQQHAAAVERARELLALDPAHPLAYDTLCPCLHAMGRDEEAAQAGTRSLELKNAQAGQAPADWPLPPGRPEEWATKPGKRHVISYSLWGAHPRYLRGAIDNALAALTHFPDWLLRFHVDETVPQDLLAALRRLGAEIALQPAGQSLRERLGWRFQVANDPAVGRFLVRDTDSVLGARERAAVDAWCASDRWFHAMRDWWTHTDLLLAGMWGGVAGALPPLLPMLRRYAPGVVETPNIDQWFLRDCVWRYVRQSILVHDRCFQPPGASAWPVSAPPDNQHVGQDVFAAFRQEQEVRLGAWIAKVPSLALRR